MRQEEKKKPSLKGKVLTILVGILGITYWMIGKAENAIQSIYQNY